MLAERTRDTDLDRDQKLAEATKDAQRALVTVDTDIPTAGLPQERVDAFKGFIRSEAYAILRSGSSSIRKPGRTRKEICEVD